MIRPILCVFFTCLACIHSGFTQANNDIQNQNDGIHENTQMIRGGVGLLQTPTARMAREGAFSVNYSDIDEYRFWTASIQLFDWLESTVRYTDVRTQRFSPFENFSGDQTLKDKGLDLKVRLVNETYFLPQVAIGLVDIGGTGLFSGEFINLSKQAGDFDFHLGFGTGYLGAAGNTRNPFCSVSDSFCDRPGGFTGLGGTVEFGEFFKGEASLFGGLEYNTPLTGLSLKLEYEGNDYRNDRAGVLEQKSRWNIGAVYQYNDWDFALSYQRGNTLGFNVSYTFDFNTVEQVKFEAPPRDIIASVPAESMETLNRARMYNDLSYQANFLLNATHQEGDHMTFYGTQFAFRDHDQATERVGRILASEMPESIRTYKIVDTLGHIPMVETVIDAQAFKTVARNEVLESDIKTTYERRNPSEDTDQNYKPNKAAGAILDIESFWIQTFGNPEAFYLYQGGVFVNTGYAFNPNFSIRGGVKVNLIENFDKFNFLVDRQESTLPRVRTAIQHFSITKLLPVMLVFIGAQKHYQICN